MGASVVILKQHIWYKTVKGKQIISNQNITPGTYLAGRKWEPNKNICSFVIVVRASKSEQTVLTETQLHIRHSFIWRRRTRKLERPSPYELVPNISQYKFNNL